MLLKSITILSAVLAVLESLGNAVSSLVSDLAKVDPEKAVEGLKGFIDKLM